LGKGCGLTLYKASFCQWVNAKGRKLKKAEEGFELKDKALFEAENDDIGPRNAFLWGFNTE
jgi:hypothetical protein